MKFLKHLDEMSAMAGQTFLDAQDMIEDAVKCIKKFGLWNEEVVWRGFGVKPISNSWIVKVTNETRGGLGFRGGWAEEVIEVLNLLELETAPVFVTKGYDNARFFGSPRIFVPIEPFVARYNPDIDDIMGIHKKWVNNIQVGGQDPTEVAKGYVVSKNSFKAIPTAKWHESIVTTKEYYLTYPDQMLQMSKKGKFVTIKDSKDIKKYSDVVKVYNEWIAYTKWFARMRAKQNPLVLKSYREQYPPEWFEDM